MPDTMLHLLFSLLCLSLSLTPPQSTLSLNQEGLFLLEFKRHLSNSSNSLSSWNPTDHTPCQWLGVTCDLATTSVTSLILTMADLHGPLPAPSLCRLPYLTSLSLPNNFISASIPHSLSACRRLRYLDLSINFLEGPIPPFLSQLTALQHLDLSYNNLTGGVPAALGNLRNHESLVLAYNLLNGTIPSSLSNMTSLKFLHLAYNPFEPSPIPSRLGELVNLEEIWLTGCNLVGTIPTSMGNLTRLLNLNLACNNLVGKIPESFAGLKSVTQIELFQNSLTGKLPLGLANLTRLEKLDASLNGLTGTIPKGLWELKLASLNLHSNNLEGFLPASIARSSNLYELKLFNNSLVGVLPTDLGSNSSLLEINLSYNRFSGEIPYSLCWHGKLQKLLLAGNYFSGKIPESLANCTSLRVIRLRNNNLSGIVPDAMWALPYVISLVLDYNSLTGPISSEISGACSLILLWISNNRFDGSIPDGIGSLNKLSSFVGSNNKFSGGIPDSMAKLTQLELLDLCCNELSGEIPGWIHGWTKLNELKLDNNKFDGSIPNELGSLSVLDHLDLSSNQLSGEIPLELQRLKLVFLNLSYNKLSGDVPGRYDNGNYKMSFVGNPRLRVNVSRVSHDFGESRHRRYAWIFGSSFVLVGAVLVIFGLAWFYLKHRNTMKIKKGLDVSKWKSFYKLGFNELEVVKLMSKDNKIGSGASGKVYKVVLCSGEVVAVKKLWGTAEKGNETRTRIVGYAKDEFDVEVEVLGKIRHKNIIRLWSCYKSGDTRLLVYEYMPNGNLAEMLKGSNRSLLDWPTRYKIAIDVAEGLAYLHHDCVPPIVHRDVKSNNILLDGEFGAKVADFGVAKIVSQGAESKSVIVGSYGYLAPEYAYTLRVNEKSDTYSFGVVILELVTGKPPIDADYGENDLVKWVSSMLEQEGQDCVIDLTLDSKYREEISTVLSVGLLCTSTLPVNRPAMRRVVKMLQQITTVPRSRSLD